MFFTLAGNRRRIEDAAAKAREEGRQAGIAIGREKARAEGIAIGREKARAEGIAIGRAEVRRQARQEIAAWYEAAKVEVAAGRIPGPPLILLENSGGNAPY